MWIETINRKLIRSGIVIYLICFLSCRKRQIYVHILNLFVFRTNNVCMWCCRFKSLVISKNLVPKGRKGERGVDRCCFPLCFTILKAFVLFPNTNRDIYLLIPFLVSTWGLEWTPGLRFKSERERKSHSVLCWRYGVTKILSLAILLLVCTRQKTLF